MEQFDVFLRAVVERGIIYVVGVIVIWRAVKDLLLGRRNGKVEKEEEEHPNLNEVSDRLYRTMVTEELKGIARNAIAGQVQLCGQKFDEITRRLAGGDKKMDKIIGTQTENHNETMRAIGRLEGLANGRN